MRMREVIGTHIFPALFIGMVFCCTDGICVPDTTNENQTVKMSGLYDNKSIGFVLDDVTKAYGIKIIGVYGSADSGRTIYVKDKTPAEFFDVVRTTFPNYSVTQDVNSGYWFVCPTDGQGAVFQQNAYLPKFRDGTPVQALQACMRIISNSWQIANWGAEMDPLMEEKWGSAWYRWPITLHDELHYPGHAMSWTGTSGPLWVSIAQILTNLPATHMNVYVITSAQIRDTVSPTSSETNYFWTIGNNPDYLRATDQEIASAIRRPISEHGESSILAAQLARIDETRFLKIYEMLDWNTNNIVQVIMSAMSDPLKRYSDVSIRIALHNIHRMDAPITPMGILLDNCYSKEIQTYITSVITNEELRWKSRVFSTVKRSPLSITDEQWKAWLTTLAEAKEYDHEEEMWRFRSVTNANILEQVRKSSLKMYAALYDFSLPVVPSREVNEKIRQAHLKFLNIDTNRSFDWVKDVVAHKDDNRDYSWPDFRRSLPKGTNSPVPARSTPIGASE